MKKILLILTAISSLNSFAQGADYNYIGFGNITAVTSWTDQIGGANPADFTTGDFHITNTTAVTLDASWVVDYNVFIENGVNFTVGSNFTITGLILGLVTIPGNGTVTVSSTAITPVKIGITQGTFIIQTTSSVYPTTYNNLVIGAITKLIGTTTCSSLIVNAGSELNLSNKILTAGTVSCLGNLKATSTASSTVTTQPTLIINGSGASSVGFTAGFEVLKTFSVSCSVASVITLNTDLTVSNIVNSVFSLNTATLDLSGKKLTINSQTTTAFGASGFIRGSTTSSLSIGIGTGTVPGTIAGNLQMDQTSSSTRSLSDLTLNRSGQILTIGNALNIINSITPTLGTIASGGFTTLIANATRSARIGIVGGSISGNVTVQTYAASSGVTGWTNLASSGISGLTVANWDGQFPITCNGCTTSTTSAGGAFASMQGGNEAGTGGTEYVTVSNTTALTPATGFWVFLGTGLSTTTPITILETGSAVQGTVPVPLTKTPAGQNGYNLIANAYTSPISWPAAAASNAALIDGSAYLYSPVGGQITLNGSGVSTPGGYNTGGVIAMGQGFYVNATSAGTFNFLESHKSAANTSANPLLKTNETNSISEFRLGITDPYGYYDETVIIADNSATSNFDNMLDAYKMFQTPGYSGTGAVYSQYTTINSLSNNKDYAINSLPLSSTQNLVIPIRAKAIVSGTYTINPLQIQNLPTTSCVTLKDKLLNINHDLRTGSYIFNLSDTTSTPRFELTICADQTVTSIKPLTANNNNVLIGQDGASGVFVKTTFDNSTKSVISAYNVMGQKIIADKEIEGSENVVYLDFKDLHNQIIIIKVSNDKGQTTKKVYLN